MFQEMEIPYISGNGNPVKITYISGKKTFLYFRKPKS